ncbi:hypothetical protein B0H14DRAFT_2938345 [Mycena olivaceomarginata]|nr:hypothetical protein B0H14DRAFT_2938345 [Mycena olivaceomarginata]
MSWLGPRGRNKPSVASVTNLSAPFLALPSDKIRTSLNVLKDSTDVFLPFKSAVGAVLAVWDLVDRVSAFDQHAKGLARRALCILITIYDAGGGGAGPISAAMLNAIVTFEGLLRDISAAMKEGLESGWLRRVQHLLKRESRLAPFTARLDVTSEVFKTGSAVRVEEQPTPATPDQAGKLQSIETVIRIPSVSGGTGGSGGMGGREGGVGGPGYGPSFQAETIMIQNCLPEYERLEKSNIRLHADVRVLYTEMRVLHTEVRFLRIVVLFGLSPISRGYLSGCVGAL